MPADTPMVLVPRERLNRWFEVCAMNGLTLIADEMEALRSPARAAHPSPASDDRVRVAAKMAHILRGMLARGTVIDAEAIERAEQLAAYRQDPTADDRAWAAAEARAFLTRKEPQDEGPTEADMLRKELETQRQQNAMWQEEYDTARRRAEAAERSAAAYRGVTTRLKNRVGRGVCPCCNRTFANLARHMAGQHPTFRAEEISDGATIQ